MKQKWFVGMLLVSSIFFIISAYFIAIDHSSFEDRSAKLSIQQEHPKPQFKDYENEKFKMEKRSQANNHLEDKQQISNSDPSKSNTQIPPQKKVFLTFDDGPSPLTNEILAIVDEKGVKATFFTIGSLMEQYPEIVKKTYDSGHMVLPHSYSHNYGIYTTMDTFYKDFAHVKNVYESILGFQAPPIFRFPGGSSNQVSCKYSGKQYMSDLTTELKKNGYSYVDWNVISGDASQLSRKPRKMLEQVINGSQNHEFIVALFHDMKSNKEILKILPEVITYYQQNSFKFRTFRNITEEEMGELTKRGIINKQFVLS